MREGFCHRQRQLILDVHGLVIDDPEALESEINQIVGVVTNGLFARRGADVLLPTADGVLTCLKISFGRGAPPMARPPQRKTAAYAGRADGGT